MHNFHGHEHVDPDFDAQKILQLRSKGLDTTYFIRTAAADNAFENFGEALGRAA